MDTRESIEFIAAILVVVVAGVVLGWALARRGRKVRPLTDHQLRQYHDLVQAMDGLRHAHDDHKQRFIKSYYAALLSSPDYVIKALNHYLQVATASEAEYNPATLSAARDAVVLALRKYVLSRSELGTSLNPSELFSVEISREDEQARKMKPPAEVPAPVPAPSIPHPAEEPAHL